MDLFFDNFGDFEEDIYEQLKSSSEIKEAITRAREAELGITRLHLCAVRHPKEVRFLLELGADIDKLDSIGRAPLTFLHSKGYVIQNENRFRASVEIM